MDLQNSSSFPENWRTRTLKQTKSEHSLSCGWKFEEPTREAEDDPTAEQNSSRVIRTELITSATMLITARLIKTLLMNVTPRLLLPICASHCCRDEWRGRGRQSDGEVGRGRYYQSVCPSALSWQLCSRALEVRKARISHSADLRFASVRVSLKRNHAGKWETNFLRTKNSFMNSLLGCQLIF